MVGSGLKLEGWVGSGMAKLEGVGSGSAKLERVGSAFFGKPMKIGEKSSILVPNAQNFRLRRFLAIFKVAARPGDRFYN